VTRRLLRWAFAGAVLGLIAVVCFYLAVGADDSLRRMGF
jgi:hypothetical protein